MQFELSFMYLGRYKRTLNVNTGLRGIHENSGRWVVMADVGWCM
jgi:hypothetical protein